MDIKISSSPHENGWIFDVRISDGSSYSDHRVAVSEDAYERLTGGRCSPTELVRWSFEFLLERESKEEIIKQFDITVISRYFSEYENKIREWLAS